MEQAGTSKKAGLGTCCVEDCSLQKSSGDGAIRGLGRTGWRKGMPQLEAAKMCPPWRKPVCLYSNRRGVVPGVMESECIQKAAPHYFQ